jgi:hypothetical protein
VRVGVELLAAAKFFFGGEIGAKFGEGLLGGLEGGFGGGDAAWSFGLVLAEALELEVLGLENYEMFEVSVHGLVISMAAHGKVRGVRSKD